MSEHSSGAKAAIAPLLHRSVWCSNVCEMCGKKNNTPLSTRLSKCELASILTIFWIWRLFTRFNMNYKILDNIHILLFKNRLWNEWEKNNTSLSTRLSKCELASILTIFWIWRLFTGFDMNYIIFIHILLFILKLKAAFYLPCNNWRGYWWRILVYRLTLTLCLSNVVQCSHPKK